MRFIKKLGFVVAIAVVIAFGGVLTYRARRIRRFEYNATPLSATDYAALTGRPGWKASLVDITGVALRGLVRPAKSTDQPWVLLFEGNSARLLEDGQRLLEAILEGRDWGGAIYAYRGYDSSAGTPDPETLGQDGVYAVRQLMREQELPASRLHLVAFSLGTSVVAAVAAHLRDNPPATITLLAPTTELEMSRARDSLRHRYETLKYLAAFDSPTLIVHGRLDDTLPVEGGRRIAEKLGDRATYIEHPALGHNDLHESRAVIDEVRAFVERHSKPAS